MFDKPTYKKMNILDGFIRKIGYKAGDALWKSGEEKFLKNVKNNKTNFRKKYEKFDIPGKVPRCIEMWRTLCLSFENEYASPINKMMSRQHENLNLDVQDLEFKLGQIGRAYPEIHDECREFYQGCKNSVINSLK
jgi:hypothetical protein